MHAYCQELSTDPEAGLERLIGYLQVASAEADLLGEDSLRQQIEDLIQGCRLPDQ